MPRSPENAVCSLFSISYPDLHGVVGVYKVPKKENSQPVTLKSLTIQGVQNAGVIDTLIAAEQRIADAGDKAWKKLPGVRQKGEKKCKIQLQVVPWAHPLCIVIRGQD